MQKITSEDGQSANPIDQNIEQLKALFPEAFSENGVNFDVLRQLLGDAQVLDEGEEKYGLTWHGKKKARQIALAPSTGALLPCPEESVNWDTTQNLFLEGDNLETLKLLQKNYANKVKVIYIDPPYNTGNEYIYPDKYSDNLETYLMYTGQFGENGQKYTSSIETGGRKHTNWLNMMYPRLKIARELLRSDGSIFVTIDDNEAANLKEVLDEIFGEENFRSMVSWQKKYAVSNNFKGIASVRDFVLIYSKSDAFNNGLLPRSDASKERYQNPDNDPRGPWKPVDYWNIASVDQRPNCVYPITNPNTGKIISPTKKSWKFAEDTHKEHVKESKIWWGKSGTNAVPALKLFLTDVRDGLIPHNWWPHDEVGHTDGAKKYLDKLFDGASPFDTPKPLRLLERILQVANVQSGDIVLDFFAGSCSTAEACMLYKTEAEGDIRSIMIQLPEPCPPKSEGEKQGYRTIADIGKERIRRAGKRALAEESDFAGDVGFKVFKLSNSSIRAWNPDRTDLEETLLSHEDHLIEGRDEQDLLYELLLKRGVDLAVPIEERKVAGKTIYSIGAGVLFACLDKSITKEQVEPVAEGMLAWHKELEPEAETHVFFRDSAFNDDNVAKTNMVAILEQNGISHVRSL